MSILKELLTHQPYHSPESGL